MKRNSTILWVGAAAAVLAAPMGVCAAADASGAAATGQDAQAVTPATTTAPDSDSGKISTLAPIVVKGETVQTQLPVGTTVTTRQMLDDRAIDSWDDFSKRAEPGVNFSRQNNSVNIRGMDEDRVVTKIDGIAIPWFTDGARSEAGASGTRGGLGAVDFDTLSAIDVVRGAGAVESGALTGALELRTLAPDDLLKPGQDFGTLTKTDYDSADDSWGANTALAGRISQGTSWLLQLGQRKGHELDNMGSVGGYGENRDKPDPANYSQHDLRLKLQHEWDGVNKLTLSGESFRRKTHTDDYSLQGPGENYEIGAAESQENISRDRVVLGYNYQSMASRSALDSGELKLYWQRMRLEDSLDATRQVDPVGAYGVSNSMQESGFGATTRWDGFVNTAVAQHWAVGGEIFGSTTKQNSSGYDTCSDSPIPYSNCYFLHTNQSDMPHVDGLKWAAWAQDEFSWANGKYALTPALRFDSYRYSPESGGSYDSNPNAGVTTQSSNSDQRVSPSLLATYKPGEDLSFYAKYGYGYKAPNATQLYLNYGSPETYLNVGNPNLKPEISHGWELGTDVGNKDLGGHLAYFDNRYRDFIDEVGITPDMPEYQASWAGQYPFGVRGYVNRARVRIYGLEFSGHWSITDNWYTWGSLAWSRGRDQDTDQYLNSVAPLKAAIALGYRTPEWGAQALLSAAAARHDVEYPNATADVSQPDFQAPGYGVVDFSAWWKPPVAKGLRVQAGIYNLFDKKYWNALDVPSTDGSAILRPIDYYTQPGRSVRVSLTYQY